MFASIEKLYVIRKEELISKENDSYFDKYQAKIAIDSLLNILDNLFPINYPINATDKLINKLDKRTNIFSANDIAENPVSIIGEYLSDEIVMNSYSKEYNTAVEWYVDKESFTKYRPHYISIQYNYGVHSIIVLIDFYIDKICMCITDEIYRRTKAIKDAISEYQDAKCLNPIESAMLHDQRLFKRAKKMKNKNNIKTMNEYFDYAYNELKDKFSIKVSYYTSFTPMTKL